ncbi:hypothetical protein N7456_006654 [Penicillium angulare]|uniref:S-adenosyl-L-methionine-dependent methyltransferase n=1 Tax=Penicillium angulare TaxID=116970 RepID=A0A9W9FI46_9EURO|nr:hypothetical protein N7456_006654 [Penicillium angulare]
MDPDEKPIVADPDLYPPNASYSVDDWESYQTLKDGTSFVPSDDQQFETYEAGHITALLMESHRENPLFRAPIGPNPQHILDIGTGQGSWAIDVADMYPHATVRGVDLYPPPVSWVPPNCILEVDDVLQEWTWHQPFDLIHMRLLDGAFTHEETDKLYKQIYRNLRPGAWVEQLGLTPHLKCDDNSVPDDAVILTWGDQTSAAAAKMGRPLDLYDRMAGLMKEAGFVDIKVYNDKWPIGPWAKDKQLKEAGTVNAAHHASGFEGYGMFLLTKFGDPVPWTKDEVHVYVAGLRKDLTNPKFHLYHGARRVWARKPYPAEEAARKAQAEQDEVKIKLEPTT